MKAKDSSIRGIVANGANIVRKTGYVSFVALGASIGLASKLIDQAYEATKDGYKASTTEPEPPTPSMDIDKDHFLCMVTNLYLQHKKGELGW